MPNQVVSFLLGPGMDRKMWIIAGVATAVLFGIETTVSAKSLGPEIIPGGPTTRPVAMPDGTLRAYRSSGGQIVSVGSVDGGRTWSPPQTEFKLTVDRIGGGLGLLDSDGEIHLILTHARGEGKPADTRFIDLWHCQTKNQRQTWTEPRPIWKGYCGAVMDIKQLSGGRILVPFAAWKKPGEEVAPNTGSNYTTVLYSDDLGKSWRLSPVKLTSPCKAGYNGSNYGAIEPTILQRNDGQVWMLMRSQTGFLYESFSKDGIDWTPARPSKFHSSTSPAALDRLPDGRIVLFWNHCEMPLRHDGDGVYGGRDALHVAISSDEGKSWQGFREVYRDPFRNETPPKRGDRGTAYPVVTIDKEGRIVLISGQGNRRTTLLVDPDWITEAPQSDDFSAGLDDWHTWKHFGPASRFWRDRCSGPRLIEHPTKRNASVLQVRRPDKKDADSASWNFAASNAGHLKLRFFPKQGFSGVDICLNNRFYNPGDNRGETDAPFLLHIPADRRLFKNTTLDIDTWSTLCLHWDLSTNRCNVEVNGQHLFALPQRNDTFGGISYLRVRSSAGAVDEAGCLIESVSVEADSPSSKEQVTEQIDSLPFRIHHPGTYQLAEDLTYESSRDAAISIMADNVNLDLNGKILRGTAGSSTGAIGISAIDRRELTIANGTIRGFYFGIDLRTGDRKIKTSQGHNIANLNVEGNWYFGIRLVGSNSVIQNCTISDTGGSSRSQHTIPHGVRLVGENNVFRSNRVNDLRLRRFPEGKGEIVAVHFDRAKNTVMENNLLIELKQKTDDAIPPDEKQERRFGVWVNGGPNQDSYLHVRNNVFYGFKVPMAFTPGTDGSVEDNVFYNADSKPIRGKPASQLANNLTGQRSQPPSVH